MSTRNSNLPTDAHTLRTMLTVILEKSLDNMERLRDREQILQMIGMLKNPNSIEGGIRHIKPTGVIRNIDDLGRVVIPKELRRTMGIAEGDTREISNEGEWIVLQPYKQFCHFCGSDKDISTFKEKYVCENCIGELFDHAN